MATLKDVNSHTIAIIGGSISGSEAAYLLASHNFKIVVFEMNSLPYGKIEDGLPNWHINLRNRQMKSIDSNLNHPNITYVPNIKVGTDFDFSDLLNEWKFSAVILANGAWQDRKLPIYEVEKVNKDLLIYQNPFIYWFNHKHEHGYNGEQIHLKNKIVVIGGGLASLDVVKAVMIEKLGAKLKEKYGEIISPFEIENKGVAHFLETFNESLESLKIEKVRLLYRRGEENMPLKSPNDESEYEIEKAKETSLRMLSKYKEKFMFEVLPHTVPVGVKEENNELKGMYCVKTELEGTKVAIIKNSEFILECDQIISSIGSTPEVINGLPYERGSLKMKGDGQYEVYGFENVFAIGNAVTGRGNIQESKQHGKKMTSKIISEHLSQDALENWLTNQNESIKENVNIQIKGILKDIEKQPEPETGIQENIVQKISLIHNRLDFSNYMEWVTSKIPERLEDQLEVE